MALASFFTWTLPAAEPAERILFVQLRWESNRVSIVRIDSKPGRLKAAAQGEGRFQLQLMDAGGGVLSTRLVEDPRIRQYEFPGADDHSLSRAQFSSAGAERIIRLALPSTAQELVLLGETPSPPPSLSNTGGNFVAARPILQRWRLPKPATAVRP